MLWWSGPEWLKTRTWPKGFEEFTVAAHSKGDRLEGLSSVEDNFKQGEVFLKAKECALNIHHDKPGKETTS